MRCLAHQVVHYNQVSDVPGQVIYVVRFRQESDQVSEGIQKWLVVIVYPQYALQGWFDELGGLLH